VGGHMVGQVQDKEQGREYDTGGHEPLVKQSPALPYGEQGGDQEQGGSPIDARIDRWQEGKRLHVRDLIAKHQGHGQGNRNGQDPDPSVQFFFSCGNPLPHSANNFWMSSFRMVICWASPWSFTPCFSVTVPR